MFQTTLPALLLLLADALKILIVLPTDVLLLKTLTHVIRQSATSLLEHAQSLSDQDVLANRTLTVLKELSEQFVFQETALLHFLQLVSQISVSILLSAQPLIPIASLIASHLHKETKFVNQDTNATRTLTVTITILALLMSAG